MRCDRKIHALNWLLGVDNYAVTKTSPYFKKLHWISHYFKVIKLDIEKNVDHRKSKIK